MTRFVLFFLLLAGFGVCAQDTITTDHIRDYIGKEVWVKGKVASVKTAADEHALAYLNIDKTFPDNVFTVALNPKYAERLKVKLDGLGGKTILVKGKVVLDAKSGSTVPQMFNPSKVVVVEPKKTK